MDEPKVYITKRTRKDGKTSYSLRWQDPASGTWKSKAAGTDSKRAATMAADLERQLAEGTYSDVKRVAWDAFTAEHVAKLPGAENQRQAENALTEFGELVGKIPPHRVAYRDIETYVTKLREKGNAQPTQNKKLRYLRSAFNRGIKRGYLVKNPLSGWQWDREDEPTVRVLTDAEETALLAKSEELYGSRITAYIVVALGTGGRRGEIVGLTWDRVDLDGAEVLFDKTKGKKPRTVPVNPDVVDVLRKIRVQTLQQAGPFTNMTGDSVASIFQRIATEAGVKDVCIHDLRRSYVTRLILAGAELPTVQKLAGHSTIQTTLKYYNAVHKDDLRAAVAKLRKQNRA